MKTDRFDVLFVVNSNEGGWDRLKKNCLIKLWEIIEFL